MKVTREWAEKTAKDFLNKANPINWDGVGEKPKEVSCNLFTYDFGSPYVELDISIDCYKEDDGSIEWCHCCEIVDKEQFANQNGCVECCEILSGYGVNSYLNLTDTILDVCNNTADWFCEVY